MNYYLGTILLGVSAFVATNVDNLFLLTLWFSRANSDLHRERSIIAGQYMGFGVIVLVSVFGYVGSLLIPGHYVGLLGVFPILLGVWELVKFGKEDEPGEAGAEGAEGPQTPGSLSSRQLRAQALSIAAVTVANGSDNIAVYIPLFAAGGAAQMIIIIGVFAVLAWVWCMAADRLAENPVTAGPLRRYGRLLMPFVLIGIGVTILAESGALALLRG